jgi:hypothetical protein
MIIVSEVKIFPFIVKMSSNVKKMKKQSKVFSIDENMQTLAEVDTKVGTRVDLAAMLSWLVSTLNTTASKQSDIKKSYLCCGPSFSKEPKSLKTSPLEELETIVSLWFKQACTANASIDGPHLKEKAPNEAARLRINSFRASNGWIKHFKKRLNLVYKSMLGESTIVNPKN